MTDTVAPARRPYTKPVITVVELAAEEAVFSACKMQSSGTGPDGVQGGCNQYNYPNVGQCSRRVS